MLNKRISTILLLLGISTGFSQKLIIEGKIDTREELKIYVSHLDKVDSTTTETGAFKFSLNIPSPVLIRVIAAVANNMRKNVSRSFFTGNGVIHIEAKSLEDYRNVPII